MFWLVETREQLNKLVIESSKEIFLLPIKTHTDVHPGLHDPVCLYVRDIKYQESYLINLSHPEALCVNKQDVIEYLTSVSKVFTTDKKALNYFYFNQNTIDLNLCKYEDLKVETHAQNFFYQRYYADPNLNRIVPIVKHFEEAEAIFEKYKDVIGKCLNTEYHNDLVNVFWFIEREGLRITTAFENHFQLNRPFLSKTDKKIFSQYNLYTATGRPSNTFNSLNFAAIPKQSKARSVFIPKNDVFVEIDLTAYHPTLIAELVGYELKTGDIYQDFADQFQTTREEAKSLVFRQLYGNIFEQYAHFELFEKTKTFIEDIWKSAMKKGYYEGFLSKQKFFVKSIENNNPQKFFNYLIQNHETANNVEILKEVLYTLNNKKTKVVLYTYDALLIDVDRSEKVIKEIIEVFNRRNLKVKISYGENYDVLQLW